MAQAPKKGAAGPAGGDPTVAGTPGYDAQGNPVKQGVVEGTATLSGHGALGRSKPLAKIIEKAMAAAIQAAYDEGVTEPDAVKERMLAARQEVLDKNREWENAESVRISAGGEGEPTPYPIEYEEEPEAPAAPPTA